MLPIPILRHFYHLTLTKRHTFQTCFFHDWANKTKQDYREMLVLKAKRICWKKLFAEAFKKASWTVFILLVACHSIENSRGKVLLFLLRIYLPGKFNLWTKYKWSSAGRINCFFIYVRENLLFVSGQGVLILFLY